MVAALRMRGHLKLGTQIVLAQGFAILLAIVWVIMFVLYALDVAACTSASCPAGSVAMRVEHTCICLALPTTRAPQARKP